VFGERDAVADGLGRRQRLGEAVRDTMFGRSCIAWCFGGFRFGGHMADIWP